MSSSISSSIKMATGCDHAGYAFLEDLSLLLKERVQLVSHGTSSGERVDYPVYAKKVAESVVTGKVDFGLLVCGSGAGMAIAANRNPGIRAVVAMNELQAELARKHNDANILCLGARLLGPDLALAIILRFLNSSFEGGRHVERIKMLG